MTVIDVSEDKLHREEPRVLELLLRDQTTRRNIVWATSSYEYLGKGFAAYMPLGKSKVTGIYKDLVQPRSAKHETEQKNRTKSHAEVFTPTWIVDKQVQVALDALKNLSFEEYIDSKWLEITCGEAPYIVTPYDTVTGEPLALAERVGFLDRKLQRIGREITNAETWLSWVIRAYQATYGYEYQGDSLLLARENLYITFLDYYQDQFSKNPDEETKKNIARIISYNIFQMDGLDYTTPYSEKKKEKVQLSLFDENQEEVEASQAQETQIKDWKKNRKIGFQRLSSGEIDMKFDVVIGNPPYDDENFGSTNKSPSIYPKFMDSSELIGDKVVLIHPARFLFNAGDTSKKWNEKKLNDTHFKILFYEQDSSKVFADTDIKGGVAISYWNKDKNFGAIKTFTHYNELNHILKKVLSSGGFIGIDSIIFNQNKFNLENLFSLDKKYQSLIGSGGKDKRFRNNVFSKIDAFRDNSLYEDDILVLGLENSNRIWKYIDRKLVDLNHENLDKYKVLLPESNGGGKLGEIFSTPLVAKKMEGYTQTFIGIGQFDDIYEAKNLLKYIKTKFLRTLLGTLKITQHNSISTWKNVPLQDFTVNSDIDWTQSVAGIDRQLYKKYQLTPEEITFIETKVKEME